MIRRVLPFLVVMGLVLVLLQLGFSPWLFASLFWLLVLVRVWRHLFRPDSAPLDVVEGGPAWASDRRKGGWL